MKEKVKENGRWSGFIEEKEKLPAFSCKWVKETKSDP